ncbi:phage tail protein [Maricaulis sp. D1M11]|uniref:phage tail protein n=1 Tax=Maricaulis sp. D1M11 TaxID=3076117 RepID=UPI0039B448B9
MKTLFKSALLASALGLTTLSAPASASNQINAYLGDIIMVGFNFCPQGFSATHGQSLSINSNQALFAVIGTTYGGDGRTTFNLPDLRGRVPAHPNMSSNTGSQIYPLPAGLATGVENVVLTTSQLPGHQHDVNASVEAPNSPSPSGALAGTYASTSQPAYTTGGGSVAMSGAMVLNEGGNQGFSTIAPSQVINFCIATDGLFPPRN